MRRVALLIDFVSLEQTLEGIAGRVKAPEEIAEHPNLVETWRYSEAAATLHQLLLNFPEQAPPWVTPHEVAGKAIFDDAVGLEGLAMLAYLAGWYKRQLKFHADHVGLSSRAKLDPRSELASSASSLAARARQ